MRYRVIGQTLSHYKILGPLGSGGMGVVYLAEDERLGRQVAIKLLPPEAATHQQALDRFRLEARTASSLNHPNICTVYDIGVHDGAPYLVMELLRGETLRERLGRGPFKIADVLDIGVQLADALGVAHAQGIVHRDIKPANIFIGDKLRVKILDFGLAKLARDEGLSSTGAATSRGHALSTGDLTRPGTALGTVAYMSPEQARGEDVDARTDLFSLGVVLYELVTGTQAFGGSTSAVIFDAILNRAPVAPMLLNPDTPQRLQDAISTALEKERDLRYQTALDLEADLKRIRRDLQSGATSSAARSAMTAVPAIPPVAPAPTPPSRDPWVVSAPGAAAGPVEAAPVETPARRGRRPRRRRRVGMWAALAIGLMTIFSVFGPDRDDTDRGANRAAGRDAGGDPDEDATTAQRRLDAKDYRAALAEANAVLARDEENTAAARVKAAAETQLAALQVVVDRANRSLSSGDVVAAAGALADAQALAPSDALVIGLAARVQQAASKTRTPPPAAQASPARPAATPPPQTATPVTPPVPSPTAPPPPPAPAAPAPGARIRESDLPPRGRRPPEGADDGTSIRIPGLPPTGAARERDEAEIRRVLETYRRAIDGDDLALARTVRPEATLEELRRTRLLAAPRGLGAPRVTVLAVTAEEAVVRLDRPAPAPAGNRVQVITLQRRDGSWIITDLGR